MSHEIRTPLTSFISMTESMEYSWDNLSDEKKKMCVQDIVEGRDRLMNLLSNLLDLSKFQQGKAAFEFKHHDVKHFIMEVVEEFKDMTHPIDMEVSSDVETNVDCDSWRIKQVIRHIMANAIKHGGKDKPIMIKLMKNNTYLQVSICDQGVGVPEDEKEMIFEPFHESQRTKRMSGGTGMGLAICKDIMKGHRGEIWLENNKNGVGSTFYFTIPYAKLNPSVYSYRLTQRS